ncbi:MAG: serine/threonine-protein phosphatase [Candidatus Eisenbacteria bacterium]|nr:serine/threonine-protein phosphatase [Candidatus Eisenbacteria bacterium]
MPRAIERSRLIDDSRKEEFLAALAAAFSLSIEIEDASGAVVARTGGEAEIAASKPLAARALRVRGSAAGRVVIRGFEHDERRADSIARAAALYLENTLEADYQLKSLAGEIVERYEEVNLLYDLGGDLACRFEEDEIARAALRRLVSLLRAESGAVFARRGTDWEALAKEGARSLPPAGSELLAEAVRRRGPALAEESSRPLAAAPILRPSRGAEEDPFGMIVLAGPESRGPFASGDLKILAAVSAQAAIAMENARLHRERRERERLERDLVVAREIRAALLPKEAPRLAGAEISGRSEAAASIGGDTYGYLPDGRGGATIVLGDVGGHDLGSALLMSSARAAVFACAAEARNPGRVLAKASLLLYRDLSCANLLFSLVAARLEARKKRLHTASAGHPPPLIARASSRRAERIRPRGLILGVEPGGRYEVVRTDLAPGDAVLFYTDGMTEARSEEGAFFGEDRLAELLVRSRRLSAEGIVEVLFREARSFAPGPSKDDLTLVALKVL